MKPRFRAPWRLVALLAIHGLAVGCLYVLVISPALEILQEQKRTIEQKSVALGQASRVDALNAGMADIDQDRLEAASKRFIQGENARLLGANLLTELRAIAADHGVSFRSISTLPNRDWSGRLFVGAQAEFAAPTRQAADLLSRIENGQPFLFVRNAKFNASADASAGEDRIDVTLEIYGATQWPKE